MTDRINSTLDNRIWIHTPDSSRYLPTVCVDSVEWYPDGNSAVILRGLLQKDRFLLDLADMQASFEVLCGMCCNPNDHEEGQTLMLMKNLRDFSWWSHDIVSLSDAMATYLNCQFTCDWVEICDS